MKKSILFVMPSLAAGGGEKSLVNLLSMIDYKQYHVDLFLFNHHGLFHEFLPSEVNVLPIPKKYGLFTLPLWKAIIKLSLNGHLSLVYNRIMFTVKNRVVKNAPRREQCSWKHLVKSFGEIGKKYDVAIGFLEKTSTYFCVDKVKAFKKIGWVHTAYDNLGMDPKMDKSYFNKLNHIVTVSEECANILKQKFPCEKNKVGVIYNIVSPTLIKKMADQVEFDVYNRQDDQIVILSIGRLHHPKNFAMAIESCRKLMDRGYNIVWNIIGEGEERKRLTRLIKENKLEGNFKLLGLKANPYPYLKQTDIYVQPSRFEGKSIAIDEARILNKPIVVTNYSTARDQINNGVDGLIVIMNSDALADGIERLIKDKELRESLTYNLSRLNQGTEEEIDKLYKLFQ